MILYIFFVVGKYLREYYTVVVHYTPYFYILLVMFIYFFFLWKREKIITVIILWRILYSVYFSRLCSVEDLCESSRKGRIWCGREARKLCMQQATPYYYSVDDALVRILWWKFFSFYIAFYIYIARYKFTTVLWDR